MIDYKKGDDPFEIIFLSYGNKHGEWIFNDDNGNLRGDIISEINDKENRNSPSNKIIIVSNAQDIKNGYRSIEMYNPIEDTWNQVNPQICIELNPDIAETIRRK